MKHTIFFINSIDLSGKKYYFIKKEAVYHPSRNSGFFKIWLKSPVSKAERVLNRFNFEKSVIS
jgi:hypothetical protein